MLLNRYPAEMERVREAYWRRFARTAPVKLRWRAIAVRHCFHALPESILGLARRRVPHHGGDLPIERACR